MSKKIGKATDVMHALTPWEIGSRICGGRAMVCLEVAALKVATTSWYFDFEKAGVKVSELRKVARGGKTSFSSTISSHLVANVQP